MSGPACSACAYRRNAYLQRGQSYSCKRETPFCKVADVRLAELACNGTPLPLEEHERLSLLVQEGLSSALMLISSGVLVLPADGESFVHLCLILHGKVFGPTGLPFAGRFRVSGDPEVYFGSGRNQRQGVDPAEIETRLRALFASTIGDDALDLSDRRVLVRCCARFLEEFFAIHPFHDGNGRVARLMLKLIVQSTERYYFEIVPEDRKSRRKYTEGLSYAHRHCHAHMSSSSSADTVRDPYRYIAQWLDARVREYVDLEIAPPAWLLDDDLL